MNHLKKKVAVALLAAAMTAAFSAGSASATTLEIGGVARTESVTIFASLKSGTSMLLKDTAGFSSKTCTTSELQGASSSPYTGSAVTVPLSSLTFSNCSRPAVTHKAGVLHIQWTSGTNGTVSSSGMEVTTGSPFGTLTCRTNEGTHFGTLTGAITGQAAIDINAVLSCSGISMRWEAIYTITSPTGLGITS